MHTKKYKIANVALRARQIAIAAGKVRNAKKTAKVLQRVNENKKMIIKSFAKGSAGVVLKNIMKESVNKVQDKKKEK